MKSLVPPLAVALLAATIAFGGTPSARSPHPHRSRKAVRPQAGRPSSTGKASPNDTIVGPPMPCIDANGNYVPCSTGGATSAGSTSAGSTSSGSTSAGATNAGSTSAGSSTSGTTAGGQPPVPPQEPCYDRCGVAVPCTTTGSPTAGATSAGSPTAGATTTGSTSAGTPTAGSTNAGDASAGATDAGTGNAGATNSGATSAGAASSGSTNAGGANAGSTNAGGGNAGSTNSGSTNSGSVDGGATSAGGGQTSGGTPYPTTNGGSSSGSSTSGGIGGPPIVTSGGGSGSGGGSTSGTADGGSASGGDTGTDPAPVDGGARAGAFDFYWEFEGLQDKQKVSGTNVRFTPKLTIYYDAKALQKDQFVSFEIKSYTLKIGLAPDGMVDTQTPHQVFLKPSPTATNPVYAYRGKPVVFASTHFADGATIPMSLSAEIVMTDFQGGTLSLSCFSPLNLTAYNRVLNVATVVSEDSTVVPPSNPNYFILPPGQALNLANYLRNVGAAPTHHTVLPATTSEAQAVGQADFGMLLRSSTVYFSNVHGVPFGLQGSRDGMLYFEKSGSGGYQMPAPSLIRTYATGTRPQGTPPFNLVLTYACSTLADPDAHPEVSFGLASGGTQRPDAAYMGFNDSVCATLKLGDATAQADEIPYAECSAGLSEHAKIVWQNLAAGQSLAVAVDLANSVAMPRIFFHKADGSAWCRKLPAIVVGDPEARLMNAYLSTSEMTQLNNNEALNTWYFIFP